MFTLIDRYLLTEIAKVFGAILLGLLAVTAAMLLLRTLEEVSLGALNNDLALRYLGYQLLRDSPHLIPPALFLATMLALGRMARDSEFIALQAGGIGPVRMYRALLFGVVPLSLLVAWLALAMQPLAAEHIQLLRALQAEQATQIAGLQAGRFYRQMSDQVVFYAGAIDQDRRLREIFLHDWREQPPRLILAESGYLRSVGGERFVVLDNGRRYDGQPGAADYALVEFARYTLRLQAAERAVRPRRATQPTSALLASEDLADRAELEHRLALPLSVFALALLAIPLTASSPRQTGTSRLMLAGLAYFAFFNLQRLAEHWLASGLTPSWLGSLWYQWAVVALVFLVLMPESFWFRRLRAALPWPLARQRARLRH